MTAVHLRDLVALLEIRVEGPAPALVPDLLRLLARHICPQMPEAELTAIVREA